MISPSTDDLRRVALLEELSMNAWPSLQTVCYDGWVLRFASGYTRRANSVHPLYQSSIDPVQKIERCERLYASRGQGCIFKMTPAAQPTGLDSVLEERGYAREAPTSVQVLDITDADPRSDDAVMVSSEVSETWLADFCSLNAVAARHAATIASMLRGIVSTRSFFSLRRSSETLAVGLAVVERGWMGLFDVVTAPDFRNQGLGRQLLMNMLSWGKANGASQAYLQVMLNNAPALHLYGKLGFREAYSYWYRVKRR